MLDWLIKKIVVWLLQWINPNKPYGTPLFDALVRLSPPFAVEAVCLRRCADGHIEVYLVQRELGESAYAGHWHIPGSVGRPNETFDDIFARLEEKEFLGRLPARKFVDKFLNLNEERGTFLSLVHLCTLEESALGGKWVRINNLPANTSDHHRNHFIPIALKAFENQN